MSVSPVGSGKVHAHLSVLKLLVALPPSPFFPYTWAFLDISGETVEDKSYFCLHRPPFPPQECGHFNNAEIFIGLFFILCANSCLNLS